MSGDGIAGGGSPRAQQGGRQAVGERLVPEAVSGAHRGGCRGRTGALRLWVGLVIGLQDFCRESSLYSARTVEPRIKCEWGASLPYRGADLGQPGGTRSRRDPAWGWAARCGRQSSRGGGWGVPGRTGERASEGPRPLGLTPGREPIRKRVSFASSQRTGCSRSC